MIGSVPTTVPMDAMLSRAYMSKFISHIFNSSIPSEVATTAAILWIKSWLMPPNRASGRFEIVNV